MKKIGLRDLLSQGAHSVQVPILGILSCIVIRLAVVSPQRSLPRPWPTVQDHRPFLGCSERGLPSGHVAMNPLCALTALFSPLPEGGIVSVALSLGFPPAAVNCLSCTNCPEVPHLPLSRYVRRREHQHK